MECRRLRIRLLLREQGEHLEHLVLVVHSTEQGEHWEQVVLTGTKKGYPNRIPLIILLTLL